MTEEDSEPRNTRSLEGPEAKTPLASFPEATEAPISLAYVTPPTSGQGPPDPHPILGAPAESGYQKPAAHPDESTWPGLTTPDGPTPGTHRLRTTAAWAGASLVLLTAGAGIGHATWKSSPPPNSTSPSTTHPTIGSGSSGSLGSPFGTGPSGSSGASGPSDVSSIAAKVDPGLVDINTSLGYQGVQAAGTGIVLTSSGLVMTNNHVIDGATTISVTDVGNQKTYMASVVGYDRSRDIALLQLHNASGLQTAPIGNSSKVSVGENVIGIGNAGGTGGVPSAAGGEGIPIVDPPAMRV